MRGTSRRFFFFFRVLRAHIFISIFSASIRTQRAGMQKEVFFFFLFFFARSF